MAWLELNNVGKYYGSHQVLKGINLTAEQHQVVCLIGPSGCGKSTLLRTINALEPIQQGEIVLDGAVVSGLGVDVNALRRKVGMVFQSYNLFPHMSVLDNITLSPRLVLGMPADQAKQQAMELLSSVSLQSKADRFPDQLSGGQQQRVALVRAMAMKPQLLLLDEITSALDPELVWEVLGIVRQLATEGMTMLLATHEMGFAKEVAHKVCFLYEGVVHEEGTPEQIFSRPQHERTQQFLSSIVAAGRLERLSLSLSSGTV